MSSRSDMSAELFTLAVDGVLFFGFIFFLCWVVYTVIKNWGGKGGRKH